MTAFFLDYGTVSNGDLDTSRLDAAAPGIRYHDSTPAARLHECLAGARIVLANKVRLDAAALAAAPDLALICLAATGTDNVDLAAARERGVAVCNIRGYCTSSVVQHVFAMILGLTRRLAEYGERVRDGDWSESGQFTLLRPAIRELDGKTLGIVGYGELGRGVARLGEALGMDLVIAERPGEQVRAGRLALEQVLACADVLSLHCPLTPRTRGLIDAAALAKLKPDALLINTARGALVDTAALAAALRAGRLGGAGIDVLPQEPPVDGDPLLSRDIPRLIVTPHMAWAAVEARQRALDEMAANIEAFAQGRARNRVV